MKKSLWIMLALFVAMMFTVSPMVMADDDDPAPKEKVTLKKEATTPADEQKKPADEPVAQDEQKKVVEKKDETGAPDDSVTTAGQPKPESEQKVVREDNGPGTVGEHAVPEPPVIKTAPVTRKTSNTARTSSVSNTGARTVPRTVPQTNQAATAEPSVQPKADGETVMTYGIWRIVWNGGQYQITAKVNLYNEVHPPKLNVVGPVTLYLCGYECRRGADPEVKNVPKATESVTFTVDPCGRCSGLYLRLKDYEGHEAWPFSYGKLFIELPEDGNARLCEE